MNVETTPLQDVLILQPKVFGDERGFFVESWNAKTFAELGLNIDFVQDNHSRSAQGILRGLHFQTQNTQGKLVRVVSGSVFDVAVDLRQSSPSFGQWFGLELSASNHRMLWVPPGFAHGFYVISESADFQYKCSNYYDPASEISLAWDDPTIGIEWPLLNDVPPQLSAKDATGMHWQQIPKFE